MSVHLPSPTQVCMIEGKAVFLDHDDIDEKTWDLLDSCYKNKYQQFHGSPYIFVEPRKIFAWKLKISCTLIHLIEEVFISSTIRL